jgi:Xaa-Pro dipeptidase
MNGVRHSRTDQHFLTWHRERRENATDRIRELMSARGLRGVVLTKPGTVSWASGAMNPPIDRTAAEDTVWMAIGPESTTVVTTGVERERIRAELLPPGVGLVDAPWWKPEAMVAAAAGALDLHASEIAADGHPGFGVDLEHELSAIRLALSSAEQAELRSLGADAAAAVENALKDWRPGVTDTDIAADIVRSVEAVGGDAPVVLVGADDRIGRFRHPVALGVETEEIVMAVLVARRHGLHVALTRYVAVGDTPALDADLDLVRQVHRSALDSARPGNTFGELYGALDRAYRDAGHEDAWEAHYQGGPIGYGQREFEIAPCQSDSPWWSVPITAGTALAINPSLPGGAKDEDTFLVTEDGLELITTTDDWPVADDFSPQRPAILRYGGGA